MERVLDKFPRSSDSGWLIAQIADITKKEGLEIISIQPVPIEVEDFYKKLRVQLKIEGSYNQAGRMLAAIDNSDNYLEIATLTASSIYIQQRGAGRSKAIAKDGGSLLSWEITISSIVPEIKK